MLLDYESTPDRFVLIERRTLALVIGGMLFVCGAIVFWFLITEGGRRSDMVFGTLGTVLGLAIMTVWPRRIVTFDRAEGIARIATLAGSWTARLRDIPLANVVGVVMRQGRVQGGAQVYNPALVLRSGERISLAINATGFRGLETTVADAARAWLQSARNSYVS